MSLSQGDICSGGESDIDRTQFHTQIEQVEEHALQTSRFVCCLVPFCCQTPSPSFLCQKLAGNQLKKIDRGYNFSVAHDEKWK